MCEVIGEEASRLDDTRRQQRQTSSGAPLQEYERRLFSVVIQHLDDEVSRRVSLASARNTAGPRGDIFQDAEDLEVDDGDPEVTDDIQDRWYSWR